MDKGKIITKVIKTVLTLLLVLFATLVGLLTYCKVWIIGIVDLAIIVILWSGLLKKKLVRAGALLLAIAMVFLCADGLFYGDKVSYKFILIRGLCRVRYCDILKSTDELIETTLPPSKFNSNGYRDSSFKCEANEEYKQYVTSDGVVLERYTPEKPNGKAILMVHGGAYIGGMTNLFNDYIKWYSEAANGATVYSVDYKLAPTYGYKEVIEDVVNAYKTVIADGFTSKDIIMSGDSAGGGLVIATNLYMLNELGYKTEDLPAGITTLSAWTNLALDTASCKSNKKLDCQFGYNDILKKSALMYAKDKSELKNKYISPYFSESYEGLPPMLMQVGNYEMLRDDTVDLAKRAREQGVDVTDEVYGGMFHEFQMLRGREETAEKAWESIHAFMVKTLNVVAD